MDYQRFASGKISKSLFLEALNRHQEIEFSLNGHQYFACPKTDPPLETIYAVLDVVTNEWMVEGSIERILLYEFYGKKTLKNNFEFFLIEYIL